MKRFFMGEQTRSFFAGFCAAVCLAALFYVVQPKAASGDDEAMLRELREMKAEISGIRQDFWLLLSAMEIPRTEEEKAAREASAEASNIISNLRGLQFAYRIYLRENKESAARPDFKPEISMLAQYKNRPDVTSGGFYFFKKSGDGKWWIGFDLKAAGKDNKFIKAKLADRAESDELHGAQDTNTLYADQDIAWLQAQIEEVEVKFRW